MSIYQTLGDPPPFNNYFQHNTGTPSTVVTVTTKEYDDAGRLVKETITETRYELTGAHARLSIL